MKPLRYEIELREEALGGGCNLRLIGLNEETGGEDEYGGGVFPLEPGMDVKDAYAAAKQTGDEWMAAFSGLELEGHDREA